MSFRDDHQFSPLHWAAKGGHTKIVEMLISRGARVHTTNMGDDTPLHLAAAHGHRDIVNIVSDLAHQMALLYTIDYNKPFFLVTAVEEQGGCELCQ
jgi:ankyrin repeat protein